MSPREFQAQLRLRRFRRAVRDGDDVTGATYAAGFGSSRGLYTAAREGLGMTPGQYARGGRGLQLATSVHECRWGRVLIATTPRGVCAVLLGDEDDSLRAELRAEFGDAELRERASWHEGWVAEVLTHLEDVRVPLCVPLDLQGTAFQLRVWQALREIPAGERRSYGELAARIGSPGAVRAVGTACGQNTVAVLIPCHRVVRKDGAPGGYRWGRERKQALLRAESGTE